MKDRKLKVAPNANGLSDFNLFIANLVILPLRASQYLGAFPFSFDHSSKSLYFSLKSFPVLAMTLRLLLTVAPFFLFQLIQTDVTILFAYLSTTERLVQIAVNTCSGIADFICLTFMIRKRKLIMSFYAVFTTKVIQLVKLGYEELDEGQANAQRGRRLRLNISMGIVLLLGIFSQTSTLVFYYVHAPESGRTWWKLGIVFILTTFWIALNHFRLLTFYFCISLIICFRAAFMSLYVLVDPRKPNRSRRIFWVVQMYKEVEVLLEEFQEAFGFQLINISCMFVMPTINATFQISKLMTTSEFGNSEMNGLAKLIPQVFSAALTFSILCDACTGMTEAAVKCVSSFRKVSTISELHDDMQDKILMFYTSALANPPRISPGSFFYLGRQTLPSILGLMTTYLIVLQQFKQQEDLTKSVSQ